MVTESFLIHLLKLFSFCIREYSIKNDMNIFFMFEIYPITTFPKYKMYLEIKEKIFFLL